MKAILDHGGPLLIWDGPENDAGSHTGLGLDVSYCTSPDCRWAHVEVTTVEESQPDGTTTRASPIHVSVHADTGEIRLDSPTGEAPPETDVADRLARVLETADGAMRKVLQKRWRHAKGATRDAWRTQDWSHWRPGLTLPWVLVFPDDPNFLFTSNGETHWADDSYCIAAGCDCRNVTLAFIRTHDPRHDPLCVIRMDMDDGTICDEAGGGPPTPLQTRLWADLVRGTPHLRDEVLRRHTELHRIAPGIRALSSNAEAPVRRSAQRPGRNAPCPCGSGRKYKKCCLGKELSTP
jgi:hypothetical protein